jgi:hypothetical protein
MVSAQLAYVQHQVNSLVSQSLLDCINLFIFIFSYVKLTFVSVFSVTRADSRSYENLH